MVKDIMDILLRLENGQVAIGEAANELNELITKPKRKNRLPKSWDELKIKKGYYVTGFSDVQYIRKAGVKSKCCKNFFPTKAEAEACLALAQLCQLRDAYNRCPYVELNKGSLYLAYYEYNECKQSVTPLGFKTKELRDEFLRNFADLIETAKPLL